MSEGCGHFDALYRQNPDPWGTERSWHERRKRDILLASLPREHYMHVFEPGCGNGVTTRALAARCGRLLAMDCSAHAIGLCRRTVAAPDDPDLEFRVGGLPRDWPDEGPFDLIVVSELAYYLDHHALTEFRNRCVASLSPQGDIALCHWVPAIDERAQPTEAVHDRFAECPELEHLVGHLEPQFRLDVWRKRAVAAPQSKQALE